LKNIWSNVFPFRYSQFIKQNQHLEHGCGNKLRSEPLFEAFSPMNINYKQIVGLAAAQIQSNNCFFLGFFYPIKT
jgi:hypothetical protein